MRLAQSLNHSLIPSCPDAAMIGVFVRRGRHSGRGGEPQRLVAQLWFRGGRADRHAQPRPHQRVQDARALRVPDRPAGSLLLGPLGRPRSPPAFADRLIAD
eukprot:scaffold134664_cov26-Prasinocladus_malaysianus.AAC.2